jgi:DNA-binding transcriptional MerR regulator/methylmalonyl-CoA mutase cobalamin-binding subunit
MNTFVENSPLALSISAVERETGLSKDVLRMWERRYGFPKPQRDENGERQYAVAEVMKLRSIKRLMDVGMRPGRIIHNDQVELNALAEARTPAREVEGAPDFERDLLLLLRAHDAPGLQSALANLLMRQGALQLEVFEEHLYTEQLQIALRAAINAFPRQTGTPRVLLTTFPGEHHGIGLLMVEALLVPEGAQCISLGIQTPLDDIRRAALAHDVHLVALSFSGAFPVRQASDGLAALRRQLPPTTTLWAGGEMTRRVRRTLPGVVLIPDLAATIGALKSWRVHWAQAAPYLQPAVTGR